MSFADLLTFELAAAAAIGLVAATVSGFAGFGLNLLMTPVLALLFAPVEAVPIVAAMGLASTARMLGGTWRWIDRREVAILGGMSVLAVPAGAWVLVHAPPDAMRRAIAAVVIVFTLVMLAGWRYRGPRNAATHAVVGLAAGFLNAGVGIGGPPVVLYQLARAGDAIVARANLVGFFSLLSVATMAVFAVGGVMDAAAVARSAVLLPFVLAGTWLGMRGFDAGGAHLWRRVALAFLLCVSALMVALG